MHGSYVVVFKASQTSSVEVGAYGTIKLPIGEYGYVGSASGNGGIESRTNRHQETANNNTDTLFWHIDYLLNTPSVSICSIFYSEEKEECEIASQLSESCRSFENIGASDCSCDTHVFQGNVTGACLRLGLERLH